MYTENWWCELKQFVGICDQICLLRLFFVSIFVVMHIDLECWFNITSFALLRLKDVNRALNKTLCVWNHRQNTQINPDGHDFDV